MIWEVDGVAVGHWSDPVARTGCTAVLFEPAAVEMLDAMREPTDLMGNGLPSGYKPGSHSASDIWRSLIDAAKEGK